MTRDVTGDALVAAQFGALAGLAWPGRPHWPLPPGLTAAALAISALGAGIAAAGGRSLGPDLTPRAAPPAGAALRTGGPYRFTRNPIYLGLLTGTAGLAVLRRRPEPLAAWAALAAVLHVKVRVEERRLSARFGEDYRRYAARTPRLLGLPRRPPG